MQDIENIERKELIDITSINIGKDLSHNKKIMDFLKQIKNPYCFLCGDVSIGVCFLENGSELSQILQDYFIGIK